MNIVEIIGLSGAALIAGAINAIAGGGSLITFPALLAAGYPSITANVTNAVALWPGVLGGSLAYRTELQGQRQRIVTLAGISIAGALLGSVLLITTSEEVFDKLVPFLILFACALLAFQSRLGAWMRRHRAEGAEETLSRGLLGTQFLAATYGAYFGGGLGIMMLAILGIFLPDPLQRLNALKVFLALIIKGVAVLLFAVFGPVSWSAAILMAAMSWAGGYFGVRIARRLTGNTLRGVVFTYGVISAIVLLVQL